MNRARLLPLACLIALGCKPQPGAAAGPQKPVPSTERTGQASPPVADDVYLEERAPEGPSNSPVSLTASDGTGLKIVSFSAKAVVQDPLAFTELHLVFENPEPRVVEGQFEITLPSSATLSRFAMKQAWGWQEGEVVELQAARRAYEDFLHRRQDPALLEKQPGNQFHARVFPIPPSGRKEIILSYSEALPRAGEPYRIHLRGLPLLAQLDVRATVGRRAQAGQASSLGGTRFSNEVIELHKQNVSPQADFTVALSAVSQQPQAGLRNGRLVVARVTPVTTAAPDAIAGGLYVLFDTSASRALGFDKQVAQLGELLAQLATGGAASLPLKLACFDQDVEEIYAGTIGGFDENARKKILARRALGASDLAGALDFVARKNDKTYRRVLVITDGIATAGATEAAAIDKAALALRQAGVERLDAVVSGGIRDADALAHLVTAGLPRDGVVLDAAYTARALARRLGAATVSHLKVKVPHSAWSWPEELNGVQPGDQVLVYADVPADQPLTVNLDGAQTHFSYPVPLTEVERPLHRARGGEGAARQARGGARLHQGRKARGAAQETRGGAVHPLPRALRSHRAARARDRGRLRALPDRPARAQRHPHRRAERHRGPRPPPAADDPEPAAGDHDQLRRSRGEREGQGEAPRRGRGRRQSPGSRRSPEGRRGQTGRQEEAATMSTVSSTAPASAPATAAVRRASRPPSRPRPPRRPRPASKRRSDRARPWARAAGRADPAHAARPRSAGPAPCARRRTWSKHRAQAGRPRSIRTPVSSRRSWASCTRTSSTPRSTRRSAGARSDAGDVLALVALGEVYEGGASSALAARAYGSIIDLFPARADLRRFAGERLERLKARPASARHRHLRQGRASSGPITRRATACSPSRCCARASTEEAFEAIDRRAPGSATPTAASAASIASCARTWASSPRPGSRPSRGAGDEIRDAARDGRRRARRPSPRSASCSTGRPTPTTSTSTSSTRRAATPSTRRRSSPSGGELYADVTTGYGPECFTIRRRQGARAYPYKLQAHYYSRGPMGYGMGKLEIIEHDGKGGLRFEERPFVVMVDHAFVDLGAVKGPLASR